MKPKVYILTAILFAISLFSAAHASPSEKSENTLSPSARSHLKLPLEDVLTLAVEADTDFAAKLKPKTIKAVTRYLKPTEGKIEISAARSVGDYLLLWIAFPEVIDGGIDLIWSVEEQKSVGTFLGGYRG
ncbi:MAG: hypothetical protein ACI8UO_004325 [Verrucomicrobiales bacterium]|jgi:hypothetical protein